MNHENALSEIISCSGQQFDPAIVNAFLVIANKETILELKLKHINRELTKTVLGIF